jgi:hypothetical protein
VGDPDVDGRIILKWILNRMYDCGLDSYGGLFVQINLGFHGKRGLLVTVRFSRTFAGSYSSGIHI